MATECQVALFSSRSGEIASYRDRLPNKPKLPLDARPRQCYLRTPRTAQEAASDRTEISPTFLSMGVRDEQSAKAFVERILPGERKLLFDIIRRKRADEFNPAAAPTRTEVHHEDLRALWYVNFLPYLGFGVLDMGTMLFVAQSFDSLVGLYLGLSVMAAAAVGDTLSNLVGLFSVLKLTQVVHYLGFKPPQLSAHQEANEAVRWVRHGARFCGVLSGCIVGMIALLFYDPPERLPPPRSYDCVDNEAVNAELERTEGRLEKHTTSAGETVPLKEVEDEPLAPEAHWKKNAVMLG